MKLLRKLGGLLRCREYVFPALAEFGEENRCRWFFWHEGTHVNPFGDTWEGKRR